MSRALMEEEFNDWLRHPMTQALVAILHAKREELRQQWEGGSFTDYDRGTTALVNVWNLGTCKGYAFVCDLTYETYVSEIEDESIRIEAPGSGSVD